MALQPGAASEVARLRAQIMREHEAATIADMLAN
jgi:hypothetical protein